MPVPTNGRSRATRRMVALAVVGSLAMGAIGANAALASPADTTPSTPDVVALAGPLADQEIAWEDCGFGADVTDHFDVSNMLCATIRVPQDWLDPDPSQTWDLRISQAKNIEATDPRYNSTILMHPGGPVDSGLSFAAATQHGTPDLRPTTNYVSFDQRGIGQSSKPECEYEWDPASGATAYAEAVGAGCSTDPEAATVRTEQTAYDMDFMRHLLGLDTVSYLGYSYGTWVGTWFGNLFAENIDRMILDSAVDGTQATIQHNYDLAHTGRDRQFRHHMLNWIARNDATYGLGGDPAVIWDRYFAATSTPEQAEAAYLLWSTTPAILAFSKNVAYPYAGEVVRLVIEEGEASVPTAGADPAVGTSVMLDKFDRSLMDETQITAAHGQLESLTADVAPQGIQTHSYALDFVNCGDGQWTQGTPYWNEFNTETAVSSPLSAQFHLLDAPPVCAYWPTNSMMPVAGDDFPETIVVQSELDALTPWEAGSASGKLLPNTSLIAVDNESVHGVFPYGTEEVDRPVIDFLLGGDRPTATIIADAKPLPNETTVFESWAPLGEDAEHEDPVFTDPNIPAGMGVLISGETPEPAPVE